MKPWILTVALGVLVALSAIAAFGDRPTATSSLVTASNIRDMVRMSEVIVIGTVTADAGQRNTARDPKDFSQPHPVVVSNAQFYTVEVDTVLKGEPAPVILVGSARSGSWRTGALPVHFDYSHFVPLKVGQRYALMLRADPFETNAYALAFEPSRFAIGSKATVSSSVVGARQNFPELPTDVFIATLLSAVAEAPITTPVPRPTSIPASTPEPGRPTPAITLRPATSR